MTSSSDRGANSVGAPAIFPATAGSISRNVIDALPDPIWFRDLEGRFLFVNKAWSTLTGVAEERILNSTGEGILFDEVTLKRFSAECEEVFRKGEVLRREEEFADWGIWFETIKTPVRDENGLIIGVAGARRDITARKLAEQLLAESERHLRESEKRYHDLFSQAPISLWHEDLSEAKTALRALEDSGVGDLDGYFAEHPDELIKFASMIRAIDVNQASISLFGVNSVDDLIRDIGQFFTRETLEVFGRELLALHRGSVRSEYEAPFRDFSGRTRTFILSLHVWPGCADTLSRVTVSMQDITERKQTEKALELSNERLRTASSEIAVAESRERRKIADLLHDDVTQLLVICKMKLGVLKEALQADEHLAAIDWMRTELDRGIQTTRSLTYALSPPVLNQLGLGAALEALIERLKRSHEIEFNLKCSGDLQHVDEDFLSMLYAFTRELIVNVIKHAKARSCSIDAGCVNGRICIVVKDDGAGFDRDPMGQIPSHEGGFGLFNIRERVAYHGGDFRIESSPGSGAKVTIEMAVPPP